MSEAALAIVLAFTLVDDWQSWQRWVVTLAAVVLAGAAGRALADGESDG